ncbi:MAG: adenylate kinase [Candidatus Aenigmatarchaeota archaeon]
MKIIMLGPPGSGKGTYSKQLSPKLGVPHISTGDIFRENIKNGTEIGRKAKEIIDKGGLVPDSIVMEVVRDRLAKPDAKKGFIFDGFPRTIGQARELDRMAKIDAVINLDVPEDVIIKRTTSRRMCKKCGAIYNVLTLKPKKPGVCDRCGGELVQRDDDKEDVIRKRLEEYRKLTEPLIGYYRKKGIIIDIRNDKINAPIEEVVGRIMEELRNV